MHSHNLYLHIHIYTLFLCAFLYQDLIFDLQENSHLPAQQNPKPPIRCGGLLGTRMKAGYHFRPLGSKEIQESENGGSYLLRQLNMETFKFTTRP